MPAHCSHQPISERTKSCLEWDEYEEAAYEMWEMRGSFTVIRLMFERLDELFPGFKDETYEKASNEMWAMSGNRDVSTRLIKIMSDRLRELFPLKLP